MKLCLGFNADFSECMVKRYDRSIRCMKNVLIRSYSVPHFSEFGLNTERYRVSPCTHSECGKMRTRITLNTDTFYAVIIVVSLIFFKQFS